jgi:hypothetical protein
MHGMTTEAGRRYIANKLTEAKNISELAAVWATVGRSYREDTNIFQLKEMLKKQMESKK